MMFHKWSKIIAAALIGLTTFIYSMAQEKGEYRVFPTFNVTQEGGSLCFPMQIPGIIQNTMLAQGLAPDPFIGSNEDSIQWISDQNWRLATDFDISDFDLKSAVDYRLLLSRVDTYAEIYVNDMLVGRTENLFRDYKFSIKSYLRTGNNKLAIRLLSPTKIAHQEYLKTGINYPADNDRNDIHYAPLIRKSQYHFGWDWGPRIVTMGIERPVLLQKVTGPTVESAYVRTKIDWIDGVKAKDAKVDVTAVLAYNSNGEKLNVVLFSPEGKMMKSDAVKAVGSKLTTSFSVTRPKLWMPNGWGEQPLYKVSIETVKGKVLKEIPFGIREIKLAMSKDSIGQAFTFIVNGSPLYVKGANYLPHDRRFGGGGRTLKQLFEEDMVPAHFNMIRVWGGGDYESEDFYQLADEHGILVWQDLPFACSTYPNDKAFRDNVSAEIQDRLSEIRNHPSIALLCGNNEVLEGIKHWGWKKKYGYSDQVWEQMKRDYDDFFRDLLADKVKEYAPHVDYIHGSPYSSNWGIPESLKSGDSHYWGVWFGGEDFSTFERNYGRFASEYGFQAFPEMKTIQSFDPSTPTDTMSIRSPLLTKRQRSFIGNERIEEYMKREYPVPTDFADFVYVGQVLQGKGMGKAIRAIRRGYPTNQGSLYWQLNDVWPTVSWSGIDYWGNYKAMQYEVRKAYSPFIVDILPDGDNYIVKITTDKKDFSGRVIGITEVMNPEGVTLYTSEFTSKSFTSPNVIEQKQALPFGIPTGHFAFITLKDEKGNILAEQTFYPLKTKDLKLAKVKPTIKKEVKKGEMTLTLSSKVLIKDVFVETPWQGARYSDNFFDLLPGRAKTITIQHPDISTTNADGIVIHTMNDILNKYK